MIMWNQKIKGNTNLCYMTTDRFIASIKTEYLLKIWQKMLKKDYLEEPLPRGKTHSLGEKKSITLMKAEL